MRAQRGSSFYNIIEILLPVFVGCQYTNGAGFSHIVEQILHHNHGITTHFIKFFINNFAFISRELFNALAHFCDTALTRLTGESLDFVNATSEGPRMKPSKYPNTKRRISGAVAAKF
jgi:hypothetical protein